MTKVVVVVGTRPEAIKLFPVFRALREDAGVDPLLAVTGQHEDALMDPLIQFFQIDVAIRLLARNTTINDFAASLLVSMNMMIDEHKPAMIVVQGDTTSCAVASLASFYRHVKVAHVEAGLRTYNRKSPFPEEINRRIASLVADLHFCPTLSAKDNLVRDQVEGSIEVVGNTVIDSVHEASRRIDERLEHYKYKFGGMVNPDQRIILITAHRRENIGGNFEAIFMAIRQLAVAYRNYSFVFVLHVNPQVRSAAVAALTGISNISLLEPLPYDEMIYLLKTSYLVMTDSGGLQEEGPALNKPVLVLRDRTERPEGIAAGCNLLAGVTAPEVVASFNRVVEDEGIYSSMAAAVNPYGSGDSSKRIAARISKYFRITENAQP